MFRKTFLAVSFYSFFLLTCLRWNLVASPRICQIQLVIDKTSDTSLTNSVHCGLYKHISLGSKILHLFVSDDIDIQAGRQGGRQAGGRAGFRQAGRQAGRQADRQAGRQASRQTGRQTGRQAGRQAGGIT